MKALKEFAVQGNSLKHQIALSTLRKSKLMTLNLAAVAIAVLAIAGAVYAQDAPSKKAPPAAGAKGSAVRGKEVFENKCSVCHYADSDAKKIGPGLKGINKRGTFTINSNKVTEESLRTWIENGDALMPPFKEILEAQQIKDVVAYVRTL